MNRIYVRSGPCLSQSCKSIEMKWLLCVLLGASVVFIGVEGEGNDNCTYVECRQLLASLNEATPLSIDYCVKYNLTYDCVNDRSEQCGQVNIDTYYELRAHLAIQPECTSNVTDTTSTPTPEDCTYTECLNLFHALNTADTSYCAHLEGVYDCLNTTSSRCPHNGIHDTIKMELDNLQVNCTCPPCNDMFDVLKAFTPGSDNYCELYVEVDRCIINFFSVCGHRFSEIYSISSQFGRLPKCNITTDPPPVVNKTFSCLSEYANQHVHVELNDDLPSFTDNGQLSAECATKHMGDFYYCSMYSHSHLRSFNSNEVFTCSLPGLWAMFNHPSLRVTVLNVVTDVAMDGPYMLVDEVTILVPASDCSQEATYHASATMDQLPTTFEDGISGVNGLESISNTNGTSVYIRIPWISTTVAIHKLGGQIGLVIQSPESVANQSLGLCSLGCPEHSKVTISEVVNRDPTSSCTMEAYLACGINAYAIVQLKTEGEIYYEKCIFDVLQSNHSNSAWMSLAMVNSWHLLGPTSADPDDLPDLPLHENQQTTTGSDTSSAANSPNTSESTFYVTMLTCCLSLYTMLYVLPS